VDRRASNPGTPDWPVGPLRWVPIENGLIDVKSPKFDDAEGRRFKLESRDYDNDNAIDGWVLVRPRYGRPQSDGSRRNPCARVSASPHPRRWRPRPP
jgi:hypothetical protein